MLNGRDGKLLFCYNQKKFKNIGHDSADGYEVGRSEFSFRSSEEETIN
jgi:hypothetical protein